MNYRRNEDKLCMGGGYSRANLNQVLEISQIDTGPEPVDNDEFKEHARITGEDAYIDGLLKAARQSIEKYCAISIVDKEITLHIRNVDEGYELPYGPVKAVTTAVDKESAALTYQTAGINYKTVDTSHAYMNIAYTTGWDIVPEDLKLAIKKQALWDYEHRGDNPDQVRGLCPEAKRIAKQYRRITWLA